ncbi:MAG: TonB-dependent receptor, partial [Bacteroidaceae bacterium]|nr:TonB-dependent receptor [Bacteroidaceae bacterium]
MIKKFLLLFLLSFMVMSAAAQRVTVSGRVTEKDGKTPIEQATVQILSLPDSTYINGCVTNSRGVFTLPAVKPGNYAVKFSFVGYLTKTQGVNLTRNKTQVNLGTITLSDDAVMLKEALVIAQAAQIEVVADTVQYNVSAYRVPEGSALEELVKKIPGAEVSEDGKITLNGKDISKILVNGKEFFGDDPSVAMKNLTVDMVDKIKAYDKKSDQARVTGIDDGEEEAVIDLTMKKGQNQGIFANLTGGIGTKGRWMGQGNVNRFNDHNQFSIMANLNNTNDMGFPGGGGGFRMGGNNGLTTRKMFGGNFAMETSKLEMGGSLRYSYSKNDVQTVSSSFNNESQFAKYSNSNSARLAKSQSLNFDYRLEWKPTKFDNLIFRPRASWSKNDNTGSTYTTNSNEDPNSNDTFLSGVQSFLSGSGISVLEALPEYLVVNLVNAQKQESLSHSKSTSVSGELQYNHKFGESGRNLTFRVNAGYSDGNSESFSNSDQWFFAQVDSTSAIRRFTHTPTKNYNYSGRITYSEPIAKGIYLQFSYQYNHRLSKNDQNTYDWSSLESVLDNPIGYLPPDYLQYRDASQSKFVQNKF